MKPLLRDHCNERPPVLRDHTFLAEGLTFQHNRTCHQRPPVLTDHIFVANGVVFHDRFYCNCTFWNNMCSVKLIPVLNNVWFWWIAGFLCNSCLTTQVTSVPQGSVLLLAVSSKMWTKWKSLLWLDASGDGRTPGHGYNIMGVKTKKVNHCTYSG